MTTKRWSVVLSVVLVLALSAQAAWAASAARTDPAGDEVDLFDGGDATDPRVDILSVSIDNERDAVVLTVEVDEVVPFTDESWRNGTLVVAGGLRSPRSTVTWSWAATAPTGSPVGLLSSSDDDATDDFSGFGCATELQATATAYVLTARDACAHGLARSMEWAAVAFTYADDLSTSAMDIAPDQSFDREEPLYFSAVGTSEGPSGPTRLAGTDRILTAIALSQDTYRADTGRAVVLTAADRFPDALAGGPLAAYTDAPLLLTGRDGLDPRTRTEMERVLGAGGTVYVLGGTDALSHQVVLDVDAAGFDARRVAGPDRFATAAAIADTVADTERGYVTVLLADGRTFTDALVAAAAAPARLGVVLLTDGETMPAATADQLDDRLVKRLAIGRAAAAAAPDVESITGANPSELSVNVAAQLSPVNGAAAVATQETFADALAGGPHIAARLGPLLLTESNTLSDATADAIATASPDLRRLVIYGGTAAISRGVEAALASKMQP